MKIYGGRSWHIDKLSKKIASRIGAINRIRDFVPTPTLHCIYNALINLNWIIVILSGVIVKKLYLTGYSTGSPSSKYEHWRASALLRNIKNIRICMGKNLSFL